MTYVENYLIWMDEQHVVWAKQQDDPPSAAIQLISLPLLPNDEVSQQMSFIQ